MAQGTDRRAEFPDPDRPLYTPDTKAQRLVAGRIKQCRKGKQVHRRNATEPRGGAVRGIPMGQHPHVSAEKLAAAWGEMGRTKAEKLAQHPEIMDPWQVRQLCDLCGVTLEWLRGWTDENAYGRYESAEDAAAMYSQLSNKDKALVSDMLTRLLGADEARRVKRWRWERDNREWLEHHPKRASEIFAPLRDYARAELSRYTEDEQRLIEREADRLEARGVDIDGMTAAELLDRARGDSVEGPKSL